MTFFSYFLLCILVVYASIAFYIACKTHARLASIEIKLLADSLNLQKNLKEQIAGAVEFHLRAASKQSRNNFKKHVK
jgi:ABC-type bacteriocin/lantibiotic exporter with double-glycine peptidase domain